MTTTYTIDNMKVIRHPAEPGKPARFDLAHEDRILDPANYADWSLAGRCLRMIDSKMANRSRINAFQMWVNWSRQVEKADVDVPGMATMWASFKPTHRQKMDELQAERELHYAGVQLAEPGITRMMAKPAPCESVQLRMKRLHEQAVVPTFGTAGSACFDIYAIVDNSAEMLFGSTRDPSGVGPKFLVVETGWAFEVPQGWVMKVYSRSGQGFNENTRLANCVGIIDSDYRGPLRVKLARDDDRQLVVRHGDRVAQAMLERVPVVELIEVDELSDTQRGEAGYGSTGR